ncbi:hypothetical protein CGLO_01298 [Colletotrichum gloeosporioides Cg-14]|uniref:Transmembrane protein n=1 Tax=Colletotrichum gloeosporioides (strain Cg-14) TaxID=1237896 RepID=T0L0T7_COLGC|nr:hypothetical protein CGLO_01298 [Colletotrichum gloeosporioides Cg-14]
MASPDNYHQSPWGANGTAFGTHPLIVGDTALEFWLSFLAFSVIFFIIPILLWCAYVRLRNNTRIKNDELCGKEDSCHSTHLRAMDLWMLFAFIVLGPVVVATAIISVIIVIPHRLFTGLTRRGNIKARFYRQRERLSANYTQGDAHRIQCTAHAAYGVCGHGCSHVGHTQGIDLNVFVAPGVKKQPDDK